MAERRMSHPASDEFFAATKGDQTMSSLINVLGPPQMPLDFNPEDRLAHERWPVEKLFEGQQVYLENQLSTMVKRTHNPFVTDIIMPLKEHQAMSFVWTKWHANRTLAAQSPVGAPPERVTQQRTQYRTTMNRYQLGFIVNTETLTNPEGEFALRLDLVNVAVAIADTFEQLGLTSLLQRKNYHRERLRQYHEPYGDPADIFFWEKFFWDSMRKDPSGRGFYKAFEEVKKAMREIIPSDFIGPEGFRSLLASGQGNEDYYIHGPGARQNVTYGADNIGTSVATGLRVHVVREFTIDRSGVRVAPLHRIRSIGDHFRLEDYASDCKPSDYSRCARTIKVFDMSEARGVFKAVDFLDALRYTERFEDDGADGVLKMNAHLDIANNVDVRFADAQLRMPASGFADMFLYRNDNDDGYSVCQVLGQMEAEAMPYSALRATAETIAEKIVSTIGRDAAQNLAAGRQLINKIYNKTLQPNDFEFFRTVVAAASASDDVVLSGNEFGSHDLPDEFDRVPANSYLPAGYGTVAGLYAIANSSAAAYVPIGAQETAQKFTDAVDQMYAAVSSMFAASHPAFSHTSVPEHFATSYAPRSKAQRRQDSKIAFAQNFLDTAKSPLVMTGAAAAHSSVSGVNAGAAPSDELAASIGAELTAAGIDANEAALIDTMRQAASSYATPATVAALKDVESIKAFREQYSQSPFASAYSRYAQSRTGASADEKREAKNNRDLSLFLKTHVRRVLDSGEITSTESLASVVNGVVNAVASQADASSRTIADQLDKWASVAAMSSANAMGGDAAPRVTRLAVSPTSLERAVRTGISANWQVAHTDGGFVDLNDKTAVTAAEDPEHSIDRLFAHSTAPVFAMSGATRLDIGGTGVRGRNPGAGGARDTVNVPGVDGNITINNNLDNNFDRAEKERDQLVQLGVKLLLFAPVSYATFERLYEADVRVPVSILAERPNRRYEAASGIFAAGGEQLGEIAWFNFNVMLSTNGMTKDLQGNATVWAAAIVKREERYFIVEDMLVTKYRGGESLKPFTKRTFTPGAMDNGMASVFYLLVPYGSLRGANAVPKTHDVRGFFNPDLVGSDDVTESLRGSIIDKPHYPSALFYSRYYGFTNFATIGEDDADYFRTDGVHDNTVTHQTMQYVWNAKTNQTTDRILNTDHFGRHGVYEGVGDLRSAGTAEHYEKQDYGTFVPID